MKRNIFCKKKSNGPHTAKNVVTLEAGLKFTYAENQESMIHQWALPAARASNIPGGIKLATKRCE
jgi:hypothetical protein